MYKRAQEEAMVLHGDEDDLDEDEDELDEDEDELDGDEDELSGDEDGIHITFSFFVSSSLLFF